MVQREPKAYKDYHWIIADPDWLGGKPALRGIRISVSQILECLSAGMTLADINESFAAEITEEVVSEVLSVGAELADKPCVAA